jgi:uncharacterized protein (TIGR00255 family)
MIRSMTAYGRGEAPLGTGTVAAEVRTLNTRHLDVRLRLPREWSEMESAVRAAVAGHFARGKVEVAIQLPGELTAGTLELDPTIAGRYVEAAEALRRRFGLDGGLPVGTLLTLPGVVRLRELTALDEGASNAVLAAVGQACRAAVEMREKEGEALRADLESRLERVLAEVTRIEARADQVKRGMRDRLKRRISALAPELGLDPARLDQEVVFYADRMDITEETVRLRSHAAQFASSLAAEEPVGRKLEFLLQELVREANTVGSKVADSEAAALVVELKSELEKLREQVLNVE